MKLTLIATTAAALFVATVATAPAASAGPEEDFLSIIADQGLSWPSGSNQAIVDGGHGVCQDWDAGTTFAQEVNDIMSVTDWNEYKTGFFIGAATMSFCPRYESKVS